MSQVSLPPDGIRLGNMRQLANAIANLSGAGSVNGLTAYSGGGQASAVPLAKAMVQVATSAADHDSVALPKAASGSLVYFANAGAHITDVYAKYQSNDVINAIITTNPFSVAAAKSVVFFCPKDGQWYAILSA